MSDKFKKIPPRNKVLQHADAQAMRDIRRGMFEHWNNADYELTEGQRSCLDRLRKEFEPS